MDRVAEAFQACPREDFLPRGERRRASYDGPLPIGHGQTNSQPRTVEAMLRLLALATGPREAGRPRWVAVSQIRFPSPDFFFVICGARFDLNRLRLNKSRLLLHID